MSKIRTKKYFYFMTNMSIQPLWLTHFIEILLVLEFQHTKFIFGTFSYKAHFRPQISSNDHRQCVIGIFSQILVSHTLCCISYFAAPLSQVLCHKSCVTTLVLQLSCVAAPLSQVLCHISCVTTACVSSLVSQLRSTILCLEIYSIKLWCDISLGLVYCT